MEAFDVALKAKQWSISGETVRFKGKFNASGDKLTGLWEIRSKKSVWQPWIELLLSRSD